jgi:inosine-uridine nucleoside N-ribohydrolase
MNFSGRRRRHSKGKLLAFSPALVTALAIALLAPAGAEAASPVDKPKPVILATDIGDDIDDTWALAFLLRCPELDLKLALGEYGKSLYRAKLLAKLLQTANHASVPVGIGMDAEPRGDGPQAEWVKEYDLGSYPGKVHKDGVQALIDTVMSSPEQITIISIGPMPNVAAALAREPRLAQRARLVGMYGSVRRGYGNHPDPAPEWNVKADPKACQKAFTAPWEITITPLDTCGIVVLDGDVYRQVYSSKFKLAATVIENYSLWSKNQKQPADTATRQSSTLFDTVAVYLAFTTDLCKMETLGIRVTDDGFTRIDPAAKKMQVATAWNNLDAFEKFLVERLTGGARRDLN